MTKKRIVLVLCFAAICLLASFAFYSNFFAASQAQESSLGQLEYALYINNYGWMHIMDYSWGENQTITRSGVAAGLLSMRAFQFQAGYSEYSPQLFIDCASGRKISFAVLAVREWTDFGFQDYLRWYLADVTITRYDTSGGASETSSAVIDQFAISFGKIGINYWRTPGVSGTEIGYGWDLTQNKPWGGFPISTPPIPWDAE